MKAGAPPRSDIAVRNNEPITHIIHIPRVVGRCPTYRPVPVTYFTLAKRGGARCDARSHVA
eukprot:3500205-Prymnesium_polylepis.2